MFCLVWLGFLQHYNKRIIFENDLIQLYTAVIEVRQLVIKITSVAADGSCLSVTTIARLSDEAFNSIECLCSSSKIGTDLL